MLPEIPLVEFQRALDRCADDLLWEASVVGPPVDAFRLAERLGMIVTQDMGLRTRGRYARLPREGRRGAIEAICVRPDQRPERRQFAVAHELGEAAAPRLYALLGVDPREPPAASREAVANALAGRLLAPTVWVRGLWRDTGGDLREIKSTLANASHELIARRLLESLRRPIVVTLTDHNRITWRRWNLSGPAPIRRQIETACQVQAHHRSEPVWGSGRDEPHPIGGAPIERVRAWPIHEPEWRREIVITELYADDAEWCYAA